MKKIKAIFQRLLPQHAVSWCCGRFVNCRWKWLKNWQIKTFIKKYQVDLNDFKKENIEDYLHFNDFFIRQPKDSLRPLHKNTQNLLSPAEGTVIQQDRIRNGQLFAVKGQQYTLASLVGQPFADEFAQGSFINIYLSPTDYHRVHMPLAGKITGIEYFPGRLFSVNPEYLSLIPYIYRRNERCVFRIQTEHFSCLIVLVAALLVNGIVCKPFGKLTSKNANSLINNEKNAYWLDQGDELAHFQFGSTVLMIVNDDACQWLPEINNHKQIKIFQPLAQITPN